MTGQAEAPHGGGILGMIRRLGPLPLRALAAVAGAGTLSTAASIGLLATSGWLITRASQRPPVLALAIAIGSVQAFALGRGVLRYLQRLAAHGLALGMLGRLRTWLFDTVEPLTPHGLPERGTGSIVTGFVADTELATEGLARAATVSVDVGASAVLGVGVAALLAPGPAAILLAASLTTVAIALGAARAGRGAAAGEAAIRADLADAVVDAIRSAPELLVYGREDLVAERLAQVRRLSRAAALRRAAAGGVARMLAVWAAGAGLTGVVLSGLAAHRAGQLSGVMLAVLAFVALAVLDQCAALAAALPGIATGNAAAARLRGLARLVPPVREPAADRSDAASESGAALAGVGVAAPGGNREPPLLEDVSLAVEAGRRVALTGPTGSGKSSVLHVLLHLLEISRGSATLGGVEVREMTHAGLNRHAAWLADDTHVFAASLSDNLRLARPDAGDAECAEALERVGLGPWYRSLPGGLRTVLGAGGRALSAGERQRLGMARALLSGAGLLLLDEPTAHIDPAAAPRLLSELLGVAGARAVLVVDHGPWPAGEVDAVVRLDGGRVISTAACARPPGSRGTEHGGTNDARQPGPWPLLAGKGGHPD